MLDKSAYEDKIHIIIKLPSNPETSHADLNSAMTGAWSEGRSQVRGDLST